MKLIVGSLPFASFLQFQFSNKQIAFTIEFCCLWDGEIWLVQAGINDPCRSYHIQSPIFFVTWNRWQINPDLNSTAVHSPHLSLMSLTETHIPLYAPLLKIPCTTQLLYLLSPTKNLHSILVIYIIIIEHVLTRWMFFLPQLFTAVLSKIKSGQHKCAAVCHTCFLLVFSMSLSLVHFELNFVLFKKQKFGVILLNMNIQFLQHHLLKRVTHI